MTETPRIYVACLAAYNNGKLHGAWIDANQDENDLHEAIAEMLAQSPEPGAEEWAIHDYDGFRGISLSEHESLGELVALAAYIEAHGDLGAGVLDHAGDLDEAKRLLDESYAGEWTTLEEWAEEHLDGTGQLDALDPSLRTYFNYEAFARDCELGGDIFTVQTGDGMVHVFWSH